MAFHILQKLMDSTLCWAGRGWGDVTSPLYFTRNSAGFFVPSLNKESIMHIEVLDAMISQRENPRRTRSRAARKRHLAKVRRFTARQSRRTNR